MKKSVMDDLDAIETLESGLMERNEPVHVAVDVDIDTVSYKKKNSMAAEYLYMLLLLLCCAMGIAFGLIIMTLVGLILRTEIF